MIWSGISSVFLLLLFVNMAGDVMALWWVGSRTIVEPYIGNPICRKSRQIGALQRNICQREPEVVREMSSGVQLALQECQSQFTDGKWNCSINKIEKLLSMGTREAAYLRSITAAGTMHALVAACSSGRILACYCEIDEKLDTSTDQQFVWGGCGEEIAYAYKKSKDFIDISGSDFNRKLNLHNNEAGRLASKRYVERFCKCHGLSGSCALKTCWRKLPDFSSTAGRLKARFDSAVQVTTSNPANSSVLVASDADSGFKQHDDEDLVFSQASPNYCKRNLEMGSLGTRGRTCRASAGLESYDLGSCEILCCGRGYKTVTIRENVNCRCKFVWCCDVVCSTCRQRVTVHRCK